MFVEPDFIGDWSLDSNGSTLETKLCILLLETMTAYSLRLTFDDILQIKIRMALR